MFVLYPALHLSHNKCQAMRGSAGSFGISTSIEVVTFPAPPSSTVFQYHWDMSIADAANGIGAFQSFVGTNIPVEFGTEINLAKSSASGRVTFTLVGGWYGPASGLLPLLRFWPSFQVIPK
jgi:FAD/FMN-containing dehydrogenase